MIKLGIVGTGGVAHWHVQEFRKIPNVDIVAACDIDEKTLKSFSNLYDIKECFNSVDELLSKCDLDGVINATPDRYHKEVALQVIENGKHIFSEKPLAENYKDALIMANAVKDKGIINMVNFSYRNSSGFQSLSNLVRSAELGQVKHVEASYYQSWLTCGYWGNWKTDDKWLWRLSTEHGSNGVLGDLGPHLFDFATYPVGRIKRINSLLKTFKDKGDTINGYSLDANDTFLSMVEFENGATGTISSTRFATGYKNKLELKIFCDRGGVKIGFDDPINEGNHYEIMKNIESEEMSWEKVTSDSSPTNFERFISAIISGKNDQPDFNRGAEIQNIMDSCSESSLKGTWIDIF